MRYFEMRHIVAFQETNVVGNVYYAHYVSWQGRCRELFLRCHAPSLIDAFDEDLALVTTRCSCEYFSELRAFDEVSLRMRLVDLAQNRITMGFDYWRLASDDEELVARGEQQVAVMRRQGEQLLVTTVPADLDQALRRYAS